MRRFWTGLGNQVGSHARLMLGPSCMQQTPDPMFQQHPLKACCRDIDARRCKNIAAMGWSHTIPPEKTWPKPPNDLSPLVACVYIIHEHSTACYTVADYMMTVVVLMMIRTIIAESATKIKLSIFQRRILHSRQQIRSTRCIDVLFTSIFPNHL